MESIDSATLKCTTLLTGYLGEHQSQLFYDHMLIRDIQLGRESLPPIPITIGQPVPIDLSDQCGRPSSGSVPALCLAVHYFQRPPLVRFDKVNRGPDNGEHADPNTSVSFNQKPQLEGTGVVSDTNCICTCVDSLDNKTILCNSSTKHNQESVRKGDARLELERVGYNFLVTLLVYYPIAHMKTANDLCSLTDQNKNIHLPPHPHEFVAYPKMLTLPIEEVGSRIVWGCLIANRLVPNSLDISNSLTFSQVQHDGSCVTDDEKVSTTPIRTYQFDQQLAEDEQSTESRLSLSAINKIRFIVASRNLYNRIGVLQRLQKEGWKLSQLKVPEMSVGRLWYSKQLVWNPDGEKITPEPSQTYPPEDITTQSMEMTKSSTSLSVLSWLGLRVQPTGPRIGRNLHVDNTEHPVGLTQSDESEENSSATCVTTVNVRMVFVRRESFECGDAICDSIRSSRFPPAKLRRTRLRGTTQSGIKLKRDGRRVLPLTENSNGTDDSQPSPEKRYRTDHEAALCVLTGASGPSEQPSAIYSYPLPWEEQPGIHHRYDSPLSPTSLIHSSIATRVKRGAYLCRRREDRPNCVDRKVNEPDLELNPRVKHDELAFDVVYQPRNRMPPKRFDLTDRDLELALQRSLTDCVKTCTTAKRKSPVPVNVSPEMTQQLQTHPNSCPVDSGNSDSYVPADIPGQPTIISNGEHSVNDCIVKNSLNGKSKVRSNRPKTFQKSVHTNLSTSDESKQCIPSDTDNCGKSTQAECHNASVPHGLETTKHSRKRNQKQSPNNTFPTKTLQEEVIISGDHHVDGTLDLELQQQLIPKIHLLKTVDGKFTVLDGPGETEETPRRNSANGKWDSGEDLRNICNSEEASFEVNVSNTDRLILHSTQSVGTKVLPELTLFSQNKPFEHTPVLNGPLNLSGKDAVGTEKDVPRTCSLWSPQNMYSCEPNFSSFSNPISQASLYTAVSHTEFISHSNESESSSKPITMWTKLTCPLPAPDSTSPRVNPVVGGDHLTILNNQPSGSRHPVGDIRLLTFSSSAWTHPNPSQVNCPPNYTTNNTGSLLIQSPNSTLSAIPETTIQPTNLANEPMLINAMHNGTTEHSLASLTNTPSLPTGHTLLTNDKTYPVPVGNAFWPTYCYPTIPHQEQLPCSPQAPILSSLFPEVNKMSTTQQLGYPHSFLPYWDSQVGSSMFHTVPITPIPSSNQVALGFPSSLALNDCSQNVLYYHPFVNSDQHFPLFSNPIPTISYATLPPTCDTTTALAVFPAPCQLQFIT